MRFTTKRYVLRFVIFMECFAFLFIVLITLLAHPSPQNLLVASLIIVGLCTAVGGIGGVILRKSVIEPIIAARGKKASAVVNSRPSLGESSIEYELNSDDLFAFYSYYYNNAPRLLLGRQMIRYLGMFTIIVEIATAVVVVTIGGKDLLPIAILMGLLAILTIIWRILFLPSISRRVIEWNVRRNHARTVSRLIGNHKTTIAYQGIQDVTNMGELTTRWDAIEWIVSTDQYLFLTVQGSGPHIVPRRAFAGETEFKQFVDTAKAYRQAAMTSPTITDL